MARDLPRRPLRRRRPRVQLRDAAKTLKVRASVWGEPAVATRKRWRRSCAGNLAAPIWLCPQAGDLAASVLRPAIATAAAQNVLRANRIVDALRRPIARQPR